MRTPEDILAAKATYNDLLTQTELSALPEGYIAGGTLTVTLGNVIVDPLIANIGGKQITKPSTNVAAMDWGGLLKINNTKYYIYLNRFGFWKVSVNKPITIDGKYGKYQAETLERYIGEFYVNSVGFYTTTEIVGIQIIGYSGEGTNEEPKEGDRRVYIDDDEISFEEYTGGSWSTVNSIKLGGTDSTGLFYPFLQCRGLVNPLADEISQEFFPSSEFRVFNFDGDYEDQDGVDDWTTKSGVVIETIDYKFGIGSLKTSGSLGYLDAPETWTVGSSQAAGVWIYFDVAGSGGSDIIQYSSTGTDDITLSYTVGVGFTAKFRKNGTSTNVSITKTLATGVWMYLAVIYDSTSNIGYLVVNDEVSSSSISGTWGATTGDSIRVITTTTVDRSIFLDELLFAPNTDTEADLFIQHYNHNVAWNTDVSTLDLLLKPATGGSVVADGDFAVTGSPTTLGIENLDDIGTLDKANDLLVVYDASAGVNKSVKPEDVGGSSGGESLVLYDGVTDQDRNIQFASDANMLWDESANRFVLDKGLDCTTINTGLGNNEVPALSSMRALSRNGGTATLPSIAVGQTGFYLFYNSGTNTTSIVLPSGGTYTYARLRIRGTTSVTLGYSTSTAGGVNIGGSPTNTYSTVHIVYRRIT